jgi:hypothetical protein
VSSSVDTSLLDEAEVDAGGGSDGQGERLFGDWRDLWIVPRRVTAR